MNKLALELAKKKLNKALNDISVMRRRLNEDDKVKYAELCAEALNGTNLAVVTDFSIPCMVNANFELVVENLQS